MEDHKKLIDWYIKREIKAAEKNPMHKKVFLDRILENPQGEVETIQVSLQKDILEASQELNITPKIKPWSFARELVVAYRSYFLGIE